MTNTKALLHQEPHRKCVNDVTYFSNCVTL